MLRRSLNDDQSAGTVGGAASSACATPAADDTFHSASSRQT